MKRKHSKAALLPPPAFPVSIVETEIPPAKLAGEWQTISGAEIKPPAKTMATIQMPDGTTQSFECKVVFRRYPVDDEGYDDAWVVRLPGT